MTSPESLPGPAYRIITSRLVLLCLEPKDAFLLGAVVKESLEHLLPWMAWAKQWRLSLKERIELLCKWRGNFDLGFDFDCFNFAYQTLS